MLLAQSRSTLLRPATASRSTGILARGPRLAPARSLVVRRYQEDGKQQEPKEDTKGSKKVDKSEEYIEALKKSGINRDVAGKIIDKWRELGADADPKVLRNLFLKQSLVPIGAVIVQLIFDAGVAYTAYSSSVLFALGPEFFGRRPLLLLDNFIVAYFAISILLDLVTLTAVLITTARMGTSTSALYSAIKTIAASPAPGLALADKATAAVNAVKVSQAMDSIAQLLSASSSDGSRDNADMLRDLSVYLVLQRAARSGDWKPENIGMSDKDANKIAAVFAQYDVNDDGRLDWLEMRRLCNGLNLDLTEEEAKAAIGNIDQNNDGYVEFSEFAEWWSSKLKNKVLS